MGLTVTNPNTLNLLNILNRTTNNQSASLTRLSTGSRINRGADDPAGLLALQNLDSELTSVDAAISANQRTDAFLTVADKSLGQITSLLKEVQSLAQASANSAGLTADELTSNQSQIDNAIASIDRIIRNTEFNGRKLLDGSQAITVSGVDSSELTDVRVYSRDPNSNSTSVNVEVVTSAAKASVAAYATTSASSDTTIQVSGRLGTEVITIEAGEALSSVAAKINTATANTGVVASATSGNLALNSQTFGSASFVKVSTISGDTTNFTAQDDSGADAEVRINGTSAAVDGLNVNFIGSGLNLSFNVAEAFNAPGSSSFTVTTGGATFQLGTESSTRVTLGIDGLYSQQLGARDIGYLSSLASGGANSVLNSDNQAANIAIEAVKQVAKAQGRIGGFQKFQVQTSLNSLASNKQGLESARSTVADVDYATETANLNRQNVLLQSAISLLGLANQQSSQILSLLR